MSTTESAGVEIVDEDRVVAGAADAATSRASRDADLASAAGAATMAGASDSPHAAAIPFRVHRGRPGGRRIPAAAAQTGRLSAQTPSTSCCIDEREAAKYIGMSVPFLRKARRMGRGPSYYRIGHAVRYRVADLEDWLAMRRVTTRDRAA